MSRCRAVARALQSRETAAADEHLSTESVAHEGERLAARFVDSAPGLAANPSGRNPLDHEMPASSAEMSGSTRPPIKSCIAGLAPRKGTWTMSSPATI